MQPVLNRKFLVMAIVVLIGASAVIFIMDPFSSRLNLRASFVDVAGLREGADVWLAGVPVGKVTKIVLLPPSPMPGAPRVDVFLSVPNKIKGVPATETIRTDSTANIQAL